MSNLDHYDIGIIKPSAGTNLCTNPSIELTTTGYTAIASTLTVSATESYWGQNSLKNAIGAGDANNASGWYYALALTTGTTYYFSVYFKGTAAKNYTIKITDAGGTVKATKAIVGTGYWGRHYVSWTCNSTATYRFTFIRNASQNETGSFYCDGVQIEAGKLTTYIDGTLDAFSNLRNVTEYYWTGVPHASTSVRIGETRSGGEEIMLSTYCKILMILGMGLTTFNTVSVPKVLGGGIYQWSRPNTRALSIPVMFSGANPGTVAAKVKEIQNVVDPAAKPWQQPIRMYFHPLADDGVTQEGETTYIDAVYEGGAESISWQSPVVGRAVLQFTAFLPLIMKEGTYKTDLTYQAALTGDAVVRVTKDGTIDNFGITETTTTHIGNKLAKSASGIYYLVGSFLNLNAIPEADNIAQRSADGVWSAMGAGLSGEVYDMTIDDAGLLYIVGTFTNAGGAATADGICTWNGSAFASITTGGAISPATSISSIAISRVGMVYVGGTFIDIGASGANYIARYNPADGSWNVVVGAKTMTNAVYDIIPDPWGDGVIVAGVFTNVGGDGTKDYLLRVTISGSTYAYSLIGSVAPNGTVSALHYDETTGRLYALGNFTTIGGVTAAGVAYYDGTNWNAMGSGITGTISFSQITSENGKVHVASTITAAGGITPPDGFITWSGNRFYGQKFDATGSTWGARGVYYDKDTGDLFWLGNITSSTVEGVTSVTNGGYGDAYPTINITGPGTVFGLQNYTTGERIDFNGLTLRAGEVLEIIFTSTGMSKCATPTRDCKPYLVEGSSPTMHLVPSTNKIGLFVYGGTSAATAAQISFIQAFASLENAGR